MIDLVLTGKKSDVSQELFAAFSNGFPMENLRPLLKSSDPDIVSLGSYLVYELGAKARCLLDDIVCHLANDDAQIRANAIMAIGDCATRFDFLALTRVIERLDDADPFVHRIVMRFIQKCEHSMLIAGVAGAAQSNPGTVFEQFVGCLCKSTFRIYRPVPVSRQILEKLISHASPVARRFGVALATRPRLVVDRGFLDLTDHIDDDECRELVRWSQEKPCLAQAEIMRLPVFS